MKIVITKRGKKIIIITLIAIIAIAIRIFCNAKKRCQPENSQLFCTD